MSQHTEDNDSKIIYDLLYREQNRVIIIGLTGRTGSGCSTVANILRKPTFEELCLKDPKTQDFNCKEDRQYEIVYNFMKQEGHWQSFTVIEISSIIFAYILKEGKASLIKFLNTLTNRQKHKITISEFKKVKESIGKLDYMFDDAKEYFNALESSTRVTSKTDWEIIDYFTNKIVQFKSTFKTILNKYYCCEVLKEKNSESRFELDLYTFLFQTVGNNLRSSGNCYLDVFSATKSRQIFLTIDKLIQLIIRSNNDKNTRICIDALRNPFELEFFKDRYKYFFAISINVEDDCRKQRLISLNLNADQLNNLDLIEYPKKFNEIYQIFYHQNILGCLEKSDIHIHNPQVENHQYFDLTAQLIRYIALMLHPGIIVPTKIERCMQHAFNAKTNSGCLSRQVGAVITDKNYSIKAVGWNEVPDGQVPCNLRSVTAYSLNRDVNSFSSYELNNQIFSNLLENLAQKVECEKPQLNGLPYCYCFKDIYNTIDKNKNQVHTRSLHAEENAFLQLSKYGSMGICGGKLFVTASPCELCSKK